MLSKDPARLVLCQPVIKSGMTSIKSDHRVSYRRVVVSIVLTIDLALFPLILKSANLVEAQSTAAELQTLDLAGKRAFFIGCAVMICMVTHGP